MQMPVQFLALPWPCCDSRSYLTDLPRCISWPQSRWWKHRKDIFACLLSPVNKLLIRYFYSLLVGGKKSPLMCRGLLWWKAQLILRQPRGCFSQKQEMSWYFCCGRKEFSDVVNGTIKMAWMDTHSVVYCCEHGTKVLWAPVLILRNL